MPKKKEELSFEEKLEKAIIPKEEEPYKIPDNWIWTRLGEIIEVKGGKRIPKGEEFSKNKTKNIYLRVTDFKNRGINLDNLKFISNEIAEKIKNYKITSKDIYLSIAGTIGKVGIIPKEIENSFLTENACKLTNINFINQHFLLNLLESSTIRNEIKNSITSSGQPKLAIFRIENFSIPLPPLEEQKRIVEKLDSLFEKTQKVKEIIEEIKEKTTARREAVLAKAFTGELTEKWRNENKTENAKELLNKINDEKLKNWEEECKKAEEKGNKKPAKPKLKSIDEMLVPQEEQPYKIPENWVWTRLGDIVDINPKKKILNYDDEENISFIPMKSVSEETGRIEQIEYEKYSKLKKGYTQFIEEDVLFAKITPCMENGKCAIAKNLKDNVGYGTTEFHVLRCSEGIVNKILHTFLRQQSFRREAEYNMTGSVGFRRVPVDFLKNLVFPLPPLEEQQEIVNILDNIFEKENKISELISLENQIEILEKSILDKAFRGELGTNSEEDTNAFELLKSIICKS